MSLSTLPNDEDDLSGLIPEVIELSPEDFDRLLDILENPPAPSPRLIEAMRTHSKLFSNKD